MPRTDSGAIIINGIQMAMAATSISFGTFEEWLNWTAANPYVFDKSQITEIAQSITLGGFCEPLTGYLAPPDQIIADTENWREGLIFKGINSRIRAVLHLIEQTVGSVDPQLRIYAPEALTPFALRLRGLFPRFIGSEFAADAAQRQALYPIAHENLMALSLPSNTFDLVSSNEVLEHVPDLDVALAEMCRVLKPCGWHLGTVPFAYMSEKSERKARWENGQTTFLCEPEYHGDPLNPSKGSLVFEIPGWDILERCRGAGFSHAEMRYTFSRRHGYIATDTMGIFVLICRK